MPSHDLVTAILGSKGGAEHLYRVHRKNGQVFALVPARSRIQARVAPLLPAQSAVARLYRTAVGLTGQCGLGFPRETLALPLPPSNAIVGLCRELSHLDCPPLLLPGNPHGPAPRLILICLDSDGRPTAVIKAGHTEAARQLVLQEAAILARVYQVSQSRIAPKGLGTVETANVSAFGMTFAPGHSPSWPASGPRLPEFLSSCIDKSRTRPLSASPLWAQLTGHQAAAYPAPNGHAEPFQRFSVSAFERFSSTPLHPCLFHGDFAPWNVRVNRDGTWTAIDWERGEFQGIPGWDWLHFVIQPAILVKKWDTRRVLDLSRQTIASPDFLGYLDTAVPGGSSGEFAEFLLRSYFLYNWHVLRPSERKDIHQALADWAAEEKRK